MPVAPPMQPVGVPARLAEMRTALASQKVEALKNRYVDPIAEAHLVEAGEHAIRKYVNGLRKRTSHQQAYDLSVLEAALLTSTPSPRRCGTSPPTKAKLLRFLYGYNS